MAILGPHGLSVHAPFTDSFDLTFAAGDSLLVEALLLPWLVQARGEADTPELWRLPRLELGLLGALVNQSSTRVTPTVKLRKKHGVLCVGFSGGSCNTLRLLGLWEGMLSDLSVYPHRVTRIHCTVDLAGVDGPASIEAVVAAGEAGVVALGRKRVRPMDVQQQRQLDVRGAHAGGVYLGAKQADIRCLVYCKRAEMEKYRLPDPGPLTRLELRLSVDGISLFDVARPSSLFWKYAAALLDAPEGVTEWAAGGTGFMLDRREERSLWEIIKARVSRWEDLRQLGVLADQLGKMGRVMLARLLCDELGVRADGLILKNSAPAAS